MLKQKSLSFKILGPVMDPELNKLVTVGYMYYFPSFYSISNHIKGN